MLDAEQAQQAPALVGQAKGGCLTQDQIDFYDREGYLILENYLTGEDLAGVKQAMSQKTDLVINDLIEHGLIDDPLKEAPFESRLAQAFRGLTDQDFLKFGRHWRDRLPGYFDLMSNPKILDAVESLIGPEIFANPIYNARPKVPGVAAGAVPWHQDRSYWPDANSNPVITVWVPIVDSTYENGCLHVLPRTHRTRVLPFHREQHTGTAYREISEKQINSFEQRVIALPVQAGSAILFNDRNIHMSTPNKSDHVRWSVDLRYQPTDQDPMTNHGVGFLARSHEFPDQVANLDDWLAERPRHDTQD
ncbi:MAG: phytanoyl-CoA dioxygenase family protein [Planctomycetota bacterium]